MKSKAEVLDLLDEYGLARLRGELEPLLLPAVRISLHRIFSPLHYHPSSMTMILMNDVRVWPPVPTEPAIETQPLGTSKIGGHPDLPPDFVWPQDAQGEPLEFFAQINFAEIAASVSLEPLPQTGLLLLFAGTDLKSWFALHYQGNPLDLVRYKGGEEIPQFGGEFSMPYSMGFELEWTVPSSDTTEEMKHIPLTQEEQSYWEFCERLRRPNWESKDADLDKGHHHLLGWDDFPFMDGRTTCEAESGPDPDILYSMSSMDEATRTQIYQELVQAGKKWRVLLEVDSSSLSNNLWNFGWKPGFFIRDEDLRAGDLDWLWVLWEKS